MCVISFRGGSSAHIAGACSKVSRISSEYCGLLKVDLSFIGQNAKPLYNIWPEDEIYLIYSELQ